MMVLIRNDIIIIRNGIQLGLVILATVQSAVGRADSYT